jgi:hypothetical protein
VGALAIWGSAAEDGRAAAARRSPLERKSRESCNEPEDRPLLPERPLCGRLMYGTRGQGGVDGQAGVCDLRPRTDVRPPPARRPPAWTWVIPAAIADMAAGVARGGHGSGTVAAAGHGCLRVRSAWSVSCRHGQPDRLCGNRSGLPQTPPDACIVAVQAVHGPDIADELRRGPVSSG